MRYIKLFCVSYYTYYDEVLLFWTLPEKLSPFLLFSSGSPVQTSHRLQTDPIGGNLLFENPLQHFYNTRAGYGNHISSLHWQLPNGHWRTLKRSFDRAPARCRLCSRRRKKKFHFLSGSSIPKRQLQRLYSHNRLWLLHLLFSILHFNCTYYIIYV